MAASSSNPTRPLALQSAPQAAAQALREAIISGEVKGGDRILEQKWSTRLGIGQPTLREAMRELEHQGLLRRTPQRGTYVAELSPEDYRQILEVRIPLEAMAVGRAAERLTDEDEKELGDIVTAMVEAGQKADIKRFHDCDVMFHRKIWELSGNSYLRDLLEMITFRLFVFAVVGRWEENPNSAKERHASADQHVGIFEGIRTRDAEAARRAFVTNTVGYWNSRYALCLCEERLLNEAAL